MTNKYNKLIELLNEWNRQLGDYLNWTEYLENDKNQIYLLFGRKEFIKRLVDNDKIDRDRVIEEIGGCIKISGLGPHYTRYSALLMLLAIQNDPIEFLLSIIK